MRLYGAGAKGCRGATHWQGHHWAQPFCRRRCDPCLLIIVLPTKLHCRQRLLYQAACSGWCTGKHGEMLCRCGSACRAGGTSSDVLRPLAMCREQGERPTGALGGDPAALCTLAASHLPRTRAHSQRGRCTGCTPCLSRPSSGQALCLVRRCASGMRGRLQKLPRLPYGVRVCRCTAWCLCKCGLYLRIASVSAQATLLHFDCVSSVSSSS